MSIASAASAQTGEAERLQKLEDELKTLKQQMAAMQETHEREICELKVAFQAQAARQTNAIAAAPAENRTLYDSLKQSAAEYVPSTVAAKGIDLDLSAVLDLAFWHDDARGGIGPVRDRMSGFEANGSSEGPENGFNLREVELGLSAEVDPYFRAWTTVSVEEDGAGVEEAVLQTTSLPYGLTLSGGKIKSGIGRLNRQHAHAWDFYDAPLVYRAMFGDEGLADTGLQLTWLAPTPFYLLLGTEVFNGGNEQSFNVSDEEEMPCHDAPRLYTVFLKTGPDLGPNHALQFGLSALSGRHQVWDGADGAGADGDSRIFGSDFVYKYDAKRSHGDGDVIVQGEYFYRDSDLDGVGGWSGSPWTARQDGYYVQGLYGFLPRWRSGMRWDQVGLTNDVNTPEEGASECGDTYRLATVLDWKLSEFSLLRAQVGRGWYDTDDGREDVWEMALQWEVTFGKHGAHDF